MKKFLIAALATLMLASCGEKKFHVEGTITNAKDSVLYFENIGLAGPEVIDSVSLSDNGDFALPAPRPRRPSSTASASATKSSPSASTRQRR